MPTRDEVFRQAAPLLRDLLLKDAERQARPVPESTESARSVGSGRSRKDAAA